MPGVDITTDRNWAGVYVRRCPVSALLIAIVGDINLDRQLDPAPKDTKNAKLAAELIGTELARRGVRLLVYGGPFLEADVVHGFVAGKPTADRCILMWYTQEKEPAAFAEEAKHPRYFDRRAESGADWETAFYRSLTRADGIVLIGGGTATKISGYVTIGARMPIVVLQQFGGAAAQVWATLSAGEDLPNRSEIDAMARPWGEDSAVHKRGGERSRSTLRTLCSLSWQGPSSS